MKVKTIALAVAATLSSSVYAQNMTIGGVWDAGVNQIDFKGNKVTTAASNNSATTVLQFRGTEDLGGGMAAHFQLEIAPALTETSNRTGGTSAVGTTSNVPSFLGNGNSWVGLRGAFGDIRFGTPNLATLTINGDGNGGFATAIGSGYRVTSFDAVRLQNSVQYITPTINGFSAMVTSVAKNSLQGRPTSLGNTGLNGNLNNQNGGRDAATEFGVNFVQGPLAIRGASLRMDQFAQLCVNAATDQFACTMTNPANAGANFRLDSASAAYQLMPNMRVAAFYQKTTSDTLSTGSATALGSQRFDREAAGVSANYTFGATTLRANYQEAKNGVNAQSTNGAGTLSTSANLASKETKTIGLGADYALSKRSALYLRYEENRDAAGLRSITGYTAATNNTTYKATGVGIRHSF